MKKINLLATFLLAGALIFLGTGCGEEAEDTGLDILSDTNISYDGKLSMPEKDTLGEDLEIVARYPGSIRVYYGQDGDEVSAGFRVQAETEAIQEYYKKDLEAKGFTTYSISEDAIGFYRDGADLYSANETVDIELGFDNLSKITEYTIYHYLASGEEDATIEE